MRPPPPASASPAQPTSGMQPKTTISSRLTWFVVALIILVATCQFGLRMLPAYEKVFADFGIKPPIVTQSVFKFGPAVLVTVGVVAAALMVLGEFTSAPNSRQSSAGCACRSFSLWWSCSLPRWLACSGLTCCPGESS